MSKYKRKQSNIISSLKRRNIELVKDLREYYKEQKEVMSDDEIQSLRSFTKRILKCANISLYRHSAEQNIIDFLAVHTCKSKTCFICNFLRQKTIRRKYALWFDDNKYIFELQNKKTGSIRYTTKKRYLEKYTETYTLEKQHGYDLMHLTLTVPHTSEGFRGERYYFETLKKQFHYMRNKCGFWNDYVLGGEFGLEATGGTWLKKEIALKKQIPYMAERVTSQGKELVRKMHSDGLHIHMHCLLLVKQQYRSRNKLHREIMLAWNRLTVDPNSEREEFSPEVRAAIKKGNSLLTDVDIDNLDPKGTTFISLETIFTLDKESGAKVRGGSQFNSDAMKRAVMETISYHFEPLAFEKEDRSIDLELLVELLPHLHGTRLYAKFGCLDGEKSLNVKESGVSLVEEFREAVQILVNEDTGEYVTADEYFLCNPALVFHKPDAVDEKDTTVLLSHKAQQQRIILNAASTREAIGQMSVVVMNSLGAKKKKGD